jgi:glucans biosynthesis protein
VKTTNNPMNQGRAMTQLANIRTSPRCGAKTRAGGACQCPAIRGRKRCRLHGGRSPGAPRDRNNGNFKDGTFTAEAVEERQWLKSVVRTYAKAQKR